VAANPDPDGVCLVAAAVLGVLVGARLGSGAWSVAAAVTLAAILAAALLGGGPRWRPLGHRAAPGPGGSPRRGPLDRRPALAGALGLATLTATGLAVAGVRATSVKGALLPRLAARGGVVVEGTVAEEPRVVRYSGRWVIVSVRRVERAGRTWRTRERAGLVLGRDAGPLAVGDRVRLRGAVERSDRADRLGGEPAVVLRRPRVESRWPARSPPLRASEAVRDLACRRALATLPRERAGLLVGMALGDTSLLGADLDHAFKAAGLSHLLAVSAKSQYLDGVRSLHSGMVAV